jgi:hypothetical protein
MRTLIAVTTVLAAAGLAATQPPPPKGPEGPVVRYGVPYRPKSYPQATPKQALASVIEAAEKNEFPYLVAHLVEPNLIDARVNARAKQFEGIVEDELGRLRESQRPNLDRIAPEARVPLDVPRFKAMVAERALARAFAQVARDVQEQMSEDPEGLKDLRRCLRWGTFPEGGAEAAFKHPIPDPRDPTMPVKDRALTLRKVGDRWFIDNRMMDDGKAPEVKPPEDKKPEDKKPEDKKP